MRSNTNYGRLGRTLNYWCYAPLSTFHGNSGTTKDTQPAPYRHPTTPVMRSMATGQAMRCKYYGRWANDEMQPGQ